MIPGFRYYHRYIRPYITEKDKQVSTILTLSLFSLVVLGGAAIRPAVITIFELNEELSKMQAAEKILGERIETVKRLAPIYTKLTTDNKTLLDQALPNEKAVPNLLLFLSPIFTSHQLVIEETFLEKEVPHPILENIFQYRVTLNLKGQYSQFLKALASLESSVRQVRVIKVLNQPSRESDTDTTDITVVLEVFYYE